MSHIMLDLETLDTSSSAVVVSIGAVRFDFDSDQQQSFYTTLTDWRTQTEKGRIIGPDTVRWWLQQSPEAIAGILEQNGCSTEQALLDFKDFVLADGIAACVWGNGADFDNIILGSLYDDFDIKKPWSYSRNRCFRTMKNLSLPREFVAPPNIGTHHNALDDALYQTAYLRAIVKALKLEM